MAIYHLEAKVVSRGAGRSAVAASAYLSCSRLYNDYDGIQHDYTKKQGLVWQEVFLPEYAPQEWQDREKLWNAVEEVETAKDSRLAREFVVALPIELNREEQIELLQEFIREQFVADGMCADAAIHDTDGRNPHAHILLTVRPLDEQGHWQYKTEKEYLCMRNGEERGFTAAEFKAAQNERWEKQYPYKVGKKKVYMVPSEADAQGLARADKHPKSTRYGRQNPISERWNSEEQLVSWRVAWADVTNRYLESAGREERIDHRSNAARGLDEIPTIHEGVTARALERKGIIADRCEINRQIKADNTLRYGKPDVSMTLNGSLAGLVAITAGCDTVSPFGAFFIGFVAGLLVVLSVEFFDNIAKVDDPVGAVSVHFANGVWGTIAVGLFSTGANTEHAGLFYGGGLAQLGTQLLGLVTVDIYVVVVMFIIFKLIDKFIGLRVPAEVEIDGLDIHEHGLASAYAGFSISDANSAAMVPNENTDLGEDDVTKATDKQISAAVPVVREPSPVIHDGVYDTGMHKVSIIAKLSKFDQLKTALNDLGVTGMTVTQVMGCGIQKGTSEKYRGVPVDTTLLPKIKVEVIVSKISVDAVVEAAKKALYTGHIGDGKIFVYNVTRVVKIRTGEEDFAALQDVE